MANKTSRDRRCARVFGVVLLLTLALLAACSRDSKPRADAPVARTATPAVEDSPALPAPPVAQTPRLESVPCAGFGVEDGDAGHPVTCSYLIVPQNRARPQGLVVKLPVVVFKAVDAAADEAPLLWLDGGPGGPSVGPMASVVTGPVGRAVLPGRSLVTGRDLILFDQRGTGHAEPSLDCPESLAFEMPGLSTTTDHAAELDGLLKSIAACRDRLVKQGVDLAAYTSAESAADINDLRVVLGVPQFNLYGVSYGTRLALTVMRDFPTIVRSAVLDSTVPVQANLYVDVAGSAQRAFDLMFSTCAATPACRTAYPELGRTFADLVARLNANPVPVANRSLASGVSERVFLTGDGFVSGMFQLLYATPVLPFVPALIAAAAKGNVDSFLTLTRQLDEDGHVARGMHYSVQCAEEMPFNRPAEIAAAQAALRPEIARVFGGDGADETAAVCAQWPSRTAAAVENEPVQSAIPTLILAGRNDPITPPAYAEVAARTLPNSAVFVFPGVAHGTVLSGSTCPHEIMTAFLKTPGVRPDGGCIAGMKEPTFIIARR